MKLKQPIKGRKLINREGVELSYENSKSKKPFMTKKKLIELD